MIIPGHRHLRSTRIGYRIDAALRWGRTRHELPTIHPINTVLKAEVEVANAVREVERLRLPPVARVAKNWDTLGALYEVLVHTSPAAQILDAGAELYSRILPWLDLYGYRKLYGNNLAFKEILRLGPIRYEPGDITATRFEGGQFDAITCLSVIEHGVDLAAYFREMARILKPGGLLVTSTDYFEEPTDTDGKHAFGGPIRIFTKQDMLAAFEIAAECGLALTGPVDLDSRNRVVHWVEQDLWYSFLVFSMKRRS